MSRDEQGEERVGDEGAGAEVLYGAGATGSAEPGAEAGVRVGAEDRAAVRAPVSLRLLAPAAVAAALAWGLVRARPAPLRLAGWALGSLVVLGLLAADRWAGARDDPEGGRRRAPPIAVALWVAVALAGAAAAALNAWAFATEVAS
ncbi:MAG TPA: hypothetical protein VFO65_14315 [Acidimicrobiales bacterium]|nr:hypothetical protein [Acidimicrobiales bacterium]